MSILTALTGRTPEQDTETDAALRDHHNAQRRREELSRDVEKLHTRLSETKRQLGDATYSGDTEACDKLQAVIDKLEAEIARTDAAIEVADQKIVAANHRLHLANVGRHLKTVRRLCNKRAKHIGELADAVATAVHAFKKINETNDLLSSSWPLGGALPEGVMVWPSEVHAAIEREIARCDNVALLEGPRFPGALRDLLQGDPTRFPPLADAIALANAHVIRLIEQGPQTPSIEPAPEIERITKSAPESEQAPVAPAPFDPDDSLLDHSQPDGAYHNPAPTELVEPEAQRQFTIHHGSIVNE